MKLYLILWLIHSENRKEEGRREKKRKTERRKESKIEFSTNKKSNLFNYTW